MFLADTAKPTGGKLPATVGKNAEKIFLSPCQRFVVGLAGVLPLPWNNTHSQPEGWVGNFLGNPPTGSFNSPEGVAKAAVAGFKALGNRPFTEDGRLLIGGFTGGEAQVYEVFLKSTGKERDKESPLNSWYEKRDLTQPVVRGLRNSWQELLDFSGATNGNIPKEATEQTDFFREVLERAIQRFNSEGENRVASPVIDVPLKNPTKKPPPAAPSTGSA